MIGILTEKPSAMRNFAKALGGVQGRYNGEVYVLTAARGHLYELKEPHEQVLKSMADQYKRWDLDYLPWDETVFKWERRPKRDAKATLKNLKATLKGCSEIVIASDDDPTGEGSLLAWEVIDELGLSGKKITRMYFVDEAPKSIQKAFIERKPLTVSSEDPDYKKAWLRTRWDFLSMQFTRIATKNGNGQAVLRNGRLKSAMNVLVGDQIKANQSYQKIPFYENRFKDENGVVYENPEGARYKTREEVPGGLSASPVEVISTQMKRTSPPKLMDLAALSARLSSKGFKAQTVLQTYQKMYEAQVVSYPRTEDKFITPEQFQELLPLVNSIADVVGVDPGLLTHRKPRPTHVKTGGSHGANRPGVNVPMRLQDLRKFGPGAEAIYELLAKNYLAMLCEDYQYEQQKGRAKNYPNYLGVTNVPKRLGFKAVFQDDDAMEEGPGLGITAKPFVHEGFPPRPSWPTMKWLMKQLETRDVGTGATRTSTFAELTNAKARYPLLSESRGRIDMTDYGEMNYEILEGSVIGNLGITEKLNGQMRSVAEGKIQAETVLSEMKDYVRHDLKVMEENGKQMRKAKGISMQTINNQYGEYVEGEWNGKTVRFKRNFRGYRPTDEEVETLLNGGSFIVELTSKAGNAYRNEVFLADLEYNGKAYVGIDGRFPEEVPKAWCGYTFTEKERKTLAEGGTVHRDDFHSKRTGNTFAATLSYGVTEQGSKGIIPDFNN